MYFPFASDYIGTLLVEGKWNRELAITSPDYRCDGLHIFINFAGGECFGDIPKGVAASRIFLPIVEFATKINNRAVTGF